MVASNWICYMEFWELLFMFTIYFLLLAFIPEVFQKTFAATSKKYSKTNYE